MYIGENRPTLRVDGAFNTAFGMSRLLSSIVVKIEIS
jgi:hypothetical protein